MTVDEQTLDRTVAFHGHLCPGLTMGMQAAAIALRDIGPHSKDEEVVAVVETDMCGTDAIQVLTGCTFGKGNLIHRDWGKNAYTFFRRSDGKAIRIAGRPDARQCDPEHQELRAKISAGEATDADRERFAELHQAQARALLGLDPDELFDVQPVDAEPPARARIHASVQCARCDERTMETRIRLLEGRPLCTPCFEADQGTR
ncbi:MAG: FmdE family protein [Egibacteraceae bacterium]